MDKLRITRLLNELLNEHAPGTEHERLKADLTAWANAKGYIKKYSEFNDGAQPDVLRGDADNAYLFVGDAKDAQNETVDNAETVERIRGYFKQFANLLGPNNYRGGYLAIATNNHAEAIRWVDNLNLLARLAGMAEINGNPPNFTIERLEGKQTWIIFW